MTRKQILDAVRACAGKLKRNPTTTDLKKLGISRRQFRRQFGSIRETLRAAGLEPRGCAYKPELLSIMLDWATVVRKLGRVPTEMEYVIAGKYSSKPFVSRFGKWSLVPEYFLHFVCERKIQKEWMDVIEAISGKALSNQNGALSNQHSAISKNKIKSVSLRKTRADCMNTVKLEWNAQKGTTRVRLRARPGRAVCGAPMIAPAMIHEPVNEDGVICLFGMLAERLGLIVRRIQGAFPDCEVLYETEPGRWMNLYVEFEFESRNYHDHGHPAEGCELLVCWIHNWRNCPAEMEVLELKRIVKELW